MATSTATAAGTSTVGYNNVGDQMLRFDGGLDLNTDPFIMAPPLTTTASDMFYLSPGQIQALPIVAPVANPDSLGGIANVYQAGEIPSFDPYITGSIFQIEEASRTYTAPVGTDSHYGPYMTVRNMNGVDPKGPRAPIWPYNTTSRVAIGALQNYVDIGGNALSVQTALAAQNPLTANSNKIVTATLNTATSGNIVCQVNVTDVYGATTAQQGVNVSLAVGTFTGVPTSRLVADLAVADTYYLCIGGQTSTGNLGVYVYTVRTVATTDAASITALTVDAGTLITQATTAIGWDATYINGRAGLFIFSSGTGTAANVLYNTLVPTSNGTLVTVTAATYNAGASFQNWPITTITTASTITSFCVSPICTFVAAGANYGVMLGFDFGIANVVVTSANVFVSSQSVTTGGLIPQTIIARPVSGSITQGYGAAFGYVLETFGSLTTYGYVIASQTVQQLASVVFNNPTGTLAVETRNYFRTQQGCVVIGKAFTANQNLATNGAVNTIYGNITESFACPIFMGRTGFDSNQAAQCGYLMDQHCKVISRFADLTVPYAINTVSASATSSVTASGLSEPLFLVNTNDFTAFEFGFPFPQPIVISNPPPATTLPTQGTSAVYPQIPIEQGGTIIFFFMRQQLQGASAPAAQKGKAMLVSGGLAMEFDGRTLHETGFNQPAQPIGPVVGTGATTFPSGTGITYSVIYTWTDANGQRHQSNVSLPRIFNPGTGGNSSMSFLVYEPQFTYKNQGYPTEVTVYAEIYKTMDATGYQYYLASIPMKANANNVTSGSVLDLATLYTDTTATPQNANFTVPYANGPASKSNEYSSDPPPPFIWQVNSQGRAFGLAQVNSTYRVYFTSLFSDNLNSTPVGQTPRWNGSGYLTVPPELGDARSLAVVDANILVFGTNGVGVFGNTGPTSLTLPSAASVFVSQNDLGFTTIVPIPNSGGIRGCGSPCMYSDGVIYQNQQGMTMMDRSLTPTFVGKDMADFTNLYKFGLPCLVPALQIMIFPNSTGPSMAYDYNGKRFSLWNSIGKCLGVFQNTVGTTFVLNGTISPTTFGLTTSQVTQMYYSGQVTPVTPLANSTMVVETPWLPMGQGMSGEGDMWEMILLGKYIQPHTLLVETAFNYGAYTQSQTIQPGIDATVATVPYQYRYRPQIGNRMQSVRYRITVTNAATGPTQCESARITGIMLYSANYRGIQRTGSGVSR